MRAIVEIHLEELEVADQQGHLTFEYYEGAKWALKRVLSELDKIDEEMMMDMMLNDYSQQMADEDQHAADEYNHWIKEDSEKKEAINEMLNENWSEEDKLKLQALREKIANQ
jgi:hypothetical protein